MFSGFAPTGVHWGDGRQLEVDAVIWCTGFRPDIGHLRRLNLPMDGAVPATVADSPTVARDRAGIFFLGYGDWAGPASATLIGVGSPARATVDAAARHVAKSLQSEDRHRLRA